ncbi:MAG TPA: fumarylacetoacetate hydrolase family protein [Candidatus Limnocylindrales bacterium]|jgi:2-keto-4-pentenoate hydratase/2-oxohepta-3-ene-1,7-dioic acid hydratase in catechol pathway|nr:fumarylacetoacetate hydrolase family protein [Candidatus Limnocylindrales bacterium]
MKYCRFARREGAGFGIIEQVNGVDHITHVAPGERIPDILAAQKTTPIPLSSARLLAPAVPSKIICVGRNYSDHAKELGNEVPKEPLIFLKSPSSLIGPGEQIVRPNRLSQRVDYEGELTVVIGKPCRNLRDDEDVRHYILGYTCANDVTARDLQKKDDQWSRAKGFDTFCPVGPIVTDEIDPWKGVRVETRLNGQVKQSESTTLFIFALDVVMRFAAAVMTLMPGDLILTGTPAGIGPMVGGDEVSVSIEGIGSLSNPVVDQA